MNTRDGEHTHTNVHRHTNTQTLTCACAVETEIVLVFNYGGKNVLLTFFTDCDNHNWNKSRQNFFWFLFFSKMSLKGFINRGRQNAGLVGYG